MSLLKEKDQALMEGVTLSKMREFLCFQISQQAVANASKKKGLPKLHLAGEIN
jgi:hypothetical protein